MFGQHDLVELANYKTYLDFVGTKIDKFFDSQKPYLCCKKGCSKCCQNAQYPFTQIEFKFLMFGYIQLTQDKKEIVDKNIQLLLKEKNNFKGEKFRYVCPFLIDDVCSVYGYRGIICRTFGLMTKFSNGEVRTPFCTYDGLNYSNVFDLESEKISPEKYQKLGIKEEPLAFNISYEDLVDEEFGKAFGFTFDNPKPMVKWFEND